MKKSLILLLCLLEVLLFGCTAHVHTAKEWIVDQEATCSTEGRRHQVCLACGEIFNEEQIPKIEHVFGEWRQVSKPTCTETGLNLRYCAVCNWIETQEVAAIGHTYTYQRVIKQPTCTEKGIRAFSCSTCGQTNVEEEIPALGHVESEWIVDKEATESETGSRHTVCNVCKAILRTEVIAKIGGKDAVEEDSSTNLTAPTNVSIDLNDVISWNSVEKATEYVVSSGDYHFKTSETCCKISDLTRDIDQKHIVDYGVRSFTVTAYNGKKASQPSSALLFYYIPNSGKTVEIETARKNYLGYGFNFLGKDDSWEHFRLTDYCASQYPVLNLDKLLSVSDIISRSMEGTTFRRSYFSSFEEYYEQYCSSLNISKGIGASGSFDVLKAACEFKASLSLAGDLSENKSTSITYISHQIYKPHQKISIELKSSDLNLLKQSVNAEFIRDLNASYSSEQRKAEYILSKYGTHICLGVTTGGAMTSTYCISTSNATLAEEIRQNVSINSKSEAGADLASITAQLNSSLGLETQATKKFKYSSSETYASWDFSDYGGTTEFCSQGDSISLSKWTVTDSSARPVEFDSDKVYAISEIIALFDENFADYYASYIAELANQELLQLEEGLSKDNSLPMNLQVVNQQNILTIDVTAYKDNGYEGVYSPYLQGNELSIYPTYFGIEIDKIVVAGGGRFPVLSFSEKWNRNISVEFRDCGTIYTLENAMIDKTHLKSGIKVDVEYTGDTRLESEKMPIYSATEFYSLILNNPSGSFQIANDLDFQGKWQSVSSFSGSIDGAGHQVIGLQASISQTEGTLYLGMFGVLESTGNISNIVFSNCSFSNVETNGFDKTGFVGVCCGINKGTISNVKISNCSVYCELGNTNDYKDHIASVGLIAGKNEGVIQSCTVSNSSATAYTSTREGNAYVDDGSAKSFAGGITGWSVSGSRIKNCATGSNTRIVGACWGHHYGNIFGSWSAQLDCNVGQILGRADSTTIEGCNVTNSSGNLSNSVSGAAGDCQRSGNSDGSICGQNNNSTITP